MRRKKTPGQRNSPASKLRVRTNYTIRLTAEKLALKLGGSENGDGWTACCPAHDDHDPSLSISDGKDGRILLFCHAGCQYEDIIKAIKTKGISLGRPRRPSRLPRGIPETLKSIPYQKHWTYTDCEGNELGHIVRYQRLGDSTKEIRPFFLRNNLDYEAGMPAEYKKDGGRPLYNLKTIAEADYNAIIYVCEGEKAAEALIEIGLIATTPMGGAQAPKKTDWEPLSGMTVYIWPDNDRPGKTFASNVFNELIHVGDSDPEIYIIDIDKIDPPLGEKDDAYDFVQRPNTTKQTIKALPVTSLVNVSDLSAIIYDNAEVHRAITESEELLMKVNPYAIFNQLGRMVRIEKVPSKNIHGEKRLSIELNKVDAHFLLDLLNKKLTYLKQSKNGFSAIDPPYKIANRYLSRSGEWKLYTLSGLIFAPTILPDGTVLDQPGYHKRTGLYYDPLGVKFESVSDHPNRENALEALNQLRNILKDFPFERPEDESVVLAAILTALIRKSITNAPLFGFTAPVAGSGKTLLANIVSIIGTGRQAVPSPQGGDREEEKKQLFSLLLQGTPIVLIDNVEHPLKSDILCQILTAPDEIYRDRILGKSEIEEVHTQVTFMATGNNLVFAGDMTRRALLCKIDPQVERPEARTDFTITNLEEHVMKSRVRYVNAGLTIIKGFIDAGKPKQKIPQYGSFEEWSGLIRESLVWLGMPDPNLTRTRVEEEDPIKLSLANIMELWREIYKENPIKAAEIVDDCNRVLERKDTDDSLHDLAVALLEATRTRGRVLSSQNFGKWLRSIKERVVDGYKIIIDPLSIASKRLEWKLTKA